MNRALAFTPMWLLPTFSTIGQLATRTYYRLSLEGSEIPRTGPVLLVANHPNSLLDPALVAAAARRPVRFLAKATLLTVPVIGWLVRGAGAIPVYRRQDDPTQMGRNVDAFEAAFEALGEGAAVGIFPEGTSHDEPSITPLRTGAARIALGTALKIGGTFPIIPVGLVFRDKGTFRSEALAVVGEPIGWSDLGTSGQTPEAVRDLTDRIDHALRAVTLNLDSWADAPLVETAYAIFAAEFDRREPAPVRLARLRRGTRRLGELRRSGDDHWRETARGVLRHGRLLERMRLTPADIRSRDPAVRSLWSAGLLPLLTALGLAGGALGSFVFWPPYKLIAIAERTLKPQPYLRSTTKVLAGVVCFGVWIGMLATAVGFVAGLRSALFTAAILPVFALATIRFHERWRAGLHELRRFYLERSRADKFTALRQRQRRLAQEIAWLIEPESGVGVGSQEVEGRRQESRSSAPTEVRRLMTDD